MCMFKISRPQITKQITTGNASSAFFFQFGVSLFDEKKLNVLSLVARDDNGTFDDDDADD